MTQVYVRWYGNVVQGELLDGDYLGMKQVRIPLDGHHPVALFMPWSVYESAELAANNSPGKSPNIPRSFPELPENFQKSAEISKLDPLVSDDLETIETFKRDNWDQEHNHLRIDKLDEFYWLWREAMRPFGFVEAEAPKEQKIKKKCTNCSCFVFTTTLGSPEKPEWHCEHGFLPSEDCQELAAYNEECMINNPAQRHAGWKPKILKGYSEITSPYPAITQGYPEITQPYSKKTKKPQIVELSLFD